MKSKIVTIVLASVYGLVLLWVILFKTLPVSEWKYLPCARHVNLIPFRYDTETGTHLWETVLNVLVFLPFGIYLGMLGVRARTIVLLGFAVSFMLETTQFVCAIGAADATDLITNTLGASIVGYGYLLLTRIAPNRDRLDRVLNILASVSTGIAVGFTVFLNLANQ